MTVLSCNISKPFLGRKLAFLTFDIPPYELNNFLDGFVLYMVHSLQIQN